MDRPSPEVEEAFPARRERWPTFLFLGTYAATLLLALRVLMSDAGAPLKAILGVAAFGVGPLVLWVLLGTRYVVTGEALLLQAGPFRFRAALADVESLSEGTRRGVGEVPRLRLAMRGGRSLTVSPRDPDAFAAALSRRLPFLRVGGDGPRGSTPRR
jgi:hypothetical protein